MTTPAPHRPPALTRRRFTRLAATGGAAAILGGGAPARAAPPGRAETAAGGDPACAPAADTFELNYILASCLYGELPLEVILPEVARSGAGTIDIWPRRHGNQREQVEAMGHERFTELLQKHGVELGIYTCYHPGFAKSDPWIRTVKNLGGSMIVANSGGPARLSGDALKEAVARFAERLKPQIDLAGELGVRIAVENHSGGTINSPESQLLLVEAIDQPHVGIALAPYHLRQDAVLLARLVKDLGPRLLHFYAWEHGHGASRKLPKVLEMKQLPGYGPLNFAPVVKALKATGYRGWTSIFMHPVPRGIPILPTAGEVTAAINRSREYLEHCLGA